jgi:hypothetical protein
VGTHTRLGKLVGARNAQQCASFIDSRHGNCQVGVLRERFVHEAVQCAITIDDPPALTLCWSSIL